MYIVSICSCVGEEWELSAVFWFFFPCPATVMIVVYLLFSDKRPNDTLWFSYNYPRWLPTALCIVFYRTLLTKNCLHLCWPFSTGSALSVCNDRVSLPDWRVLRFRFVYQLIKRRKATGRAIGADSRHKPSANTTESSMYCTFHTHSFRTYRCVVLSTRCKPGRLQTNY